jgi:hypothetical protein
LKSKKLTTNAIIIGHHRLVFFIVPKIDGLVVVGGYERRASEMEAGVASLERPKKG